jgi:hypothetical protein
MGLSHQFNCPVGFTLSDPWQCLYFFPDPQMHAEFLLMAEKSNEIALGIFVVRFESVFRSWLIFVSGYRYGNTGH